MKRKSVIIILAAIACLMLATACGNTQEATPAMQENSLINTAPDLMQIRNICQLATLECCYNNVAKSTKTPGKGIAHIGEAEREFWIEYSGTAKIGVDMSKIQMEISDNVVNITIPNAELLDIVVDNKENKRVISPDKSFLFAENDITTEDQTNAIATAQDQVKTDFSTNNSLLTLAQDRAKKLIENYINQIGKLTGTTYIINWNYADNITDNTQSNESTEAIS